MPTNPNPIDYANPRPAAPAEKSLPLRTYPLGTRPLRLWPWVVAVLVIAGGIAAAVLIPRQLQQQARDREERRAVAECLEAVRQIRADHAAGVSADKLAADEAAAQVVFDRNDPFKLSSKRRAAVLNLNSARLRYGVASVAGRDAVAEADELLAKAEAEIAADK